MHLRNIGADSSTVTGWFIISFLYHANWVHSLKCYICIDPQGDSLPIRIADHMTSCSSGSVTPSLKECPTDADYLCHQYAFPSLDDPGQFQLFKGCRESTGKVSFTVSPPVRPVTGMQCHWDATHSCWCATDGCNSHTGKEIVLLPKQYMVGKPIGEEVLLLELPADYLPFRSLDTGTTAGNETSSSMPRSVMLSTGIPLLVGCLQLLRVSAWSEV